MTDALPPAAFAAARDVLAGLPDAAKRHGVTQRQILEATRNITNALIRLDGTLDATASAVAEAINDRG